MSLPKVLVVLGPTASGKTELALKLAKKFNGELLNADSRQIYRGLNIATAKVKTKAVKTHLLNLVKPNQNFSVVKYQLAADKKIKQIIKRGKLPILVGGTGLYLAAVVDNWQIPKLKVDLNLRKKIAKLTARQLYQKLKSLDPISAKNIGQHNQRRLIRAVEVCLLSGRPFSQLQQKGQPKYQVLQLGLKISRQELYRRINARVLRMFKQGLVAETKKLLKKYSAALPAMSSIGYREVVKFLQGEIKLVDCQELIKINTRHYAKRQITWFKRDQRIKWVKNFKAAQKLVKKFVE
ncbi:MAG: tRNA (adenosine(37)-N6)-dimethylallyltransferase MiaA [Candidatus Buchananbacteria bacterium]